VFELLALMLISQQPLQHVAQGVASYYTVESSGSRTASGDLMDNSLYTCAMRTEALGSYVLVVADNGKSVVCRVNDRGPFRKGRVIDLSEAAMRRLHDDAGTLKVKVFRIDLNGLLNPFKES